MSHPGFVSSGPVRFLGTPALFGSSNQLARRCVACACQQHEAVSNNCGSSLWKMSVRFLYCFMSHTLHGTNTTCCTWGVCRGSSTGWNGPKWDGVSVLAPVQNYGGYCAKLEARMSSYSTSLERVIKVFMNVTVLTVRFFFKDLHSLDWFTT